MSENAIVDILNALPTSKLISTVSAGIGKLYEPTHIKRMAKAKAEEMKLISGAMEECLVIPIRYDNGTLSMNSSDWDDFVKRTQGRMAFQELQKQKNIDSVVVSAYSILENEQSCSEEPVEQGWINSFFDAVSNVSDEDLQNLWSKVLAGEIIQPKSYSLRTLETLKKLSKYEAELFQTITPYILTLSGSLFLPSDTELLNKNGITYGDIVTLDECGLINSGGLVSLNLLVSETKPAAIYNRSKLIVIHGNEMDDVKISIGEFGLTKVGVELFRILDCKFNDEYIYDFAEKIAKKYSKKIKVTVHKINHIDLDQIDYEKTVLREFPVRDEHSTQEEVKTIS